MARIIGGIATSHTPTIGFAYDQKKQDDPIWAPIFKGYEPAVKWLEDNKPDVLFFIYNDHVTSFFFDHYSAFALGIGEEYRTADEGGGPRALPPIKGHLGLAHHIGQALVADEFDMSAFQDKPMDHGFFSPLSMLCPHEPEWPVQVVPLQIGVLQFPIPSAKRCWKLGQSLRRAIESYPEDLKVALIATGGVSHQVHGERCGFNNVAWDEQFLDIFEKDPIKLTEMTHAELGELGGWEGAEIIMWLVMRGALSANIKKLHQAYYLPSMTGIAVAVYENEDIAPMGSAANDRYREHMVEQVKGAEKLEGTYPFTYARSVKGYRLNKFIHNLIHKDRRDAFKADQEAEFEKAGLTEEERRMLRDLDWQALIRYGASFFMLEKLGAVVGVSNLHIYAAMKGMTLEDFQKTRNAQVMYSVAGDEDNSKEWDKPAAQ